MARFVDLAPLLVDDIEVQFEEGGETYKCPGSPDVPRMLKWISFQERGGDDDADGLKLLEDVYQDLLDLFRVYQPDLETLPIHQEQIMPLFEQLFSAASEQSAPPTKRQPQRKPRS